VSRRILVVAAVAAGLALLYVATLSQAGFECEACVADAGVSACRTATGDSREQAEQVAVANACAVVAVGVTATLECQRSRIASLRCHARGRSASGGEGG
jgi:hypothetical protein